MKVCHVQRSLHTVKTCAKNWLYVQEVCNGNYHLLIHIRFISKREYIQFLRQLYHIVVDGCIQWERNMDSFNGNSFNEIKLQFIYINCMPIMYRYIQLKCH